MIAWIFSGQGSQAPGMGRALYEAGGAGKAVLDMAEELRPGLLSLCFDGPAEELSRTVNAQPCLLALELAIAAELSAAGLRPDMTAGFSLGEWAALTLAGVVSAQDALRIIQSRAAYMQDAAAACPGGMAAVLGLPAQEVAQMCGALAEGFCDAVNYNAPGQTVVAGDEAGLAALKPLVAAQKGKWMPLRVSGPFHSRAMRPAAQRLLADLSALPMAAPALPWYPNATGVRYDACEPLPELAARQCASPVWWEASVRAMAAAGAKAFVEIGPGGVLCGLARRIVPDVPAYPVDSPETLRAALSALR